MVVPEEMIILDTAKAAQLFAKFDVPIAGYIVNRVLPSDLVGKDVPPYLLNRVKMQDRYLLEVNKTFGNQVIGRVPELERDVTGLAMIEKLAGLMYGNGRK